MAKSFLTWTWNRDRTAFASSTFRTGDSTIFRSRTAASFLRSRTDGGLLPAPVTAKTVFLAPAERADIVVDFSQYRGDQIVLQNGVVEVMQFRVARTVNACPSEAAAGQVEGCPEDSRIASDPYPLSDSGRKRGRTCRADDSSPERGAGGTNPSPRNPVLGTTEIWAFVNLTEDSHPIHLHLVRFQILDRRPFDDTEYQTHQKLRYTGDAVPPLPVRAGGRTPCRLIRKWSRASSFPSRASRAATSGIATFSSTKTTR